MAEARPNIAIAPIRIDARIIVFLCLGVCCSLSRRLTGDNRPNELSPDGYTREPSAITFSRLLGTMARHLSRSIERIT